MNLEKDFAVFLAALPNSAVFSNKQKLSKIYSPNILLESRKIFGLDPFSWQHPCPDPNINRLYDWVHNPTIPELPTYLSKWLLDSSNVSNKNTLNFRYFLWLIVDVLGAVNCLDKKQGLTITNSEFLIQINNAKLGWVHDRWGIWTDTALRVHQANAKWAISPLKSLNSFRNSPKNLKDKWIYDLYAYISGAFPYVFSCPDNKINFLTVLEMARILFPASQTSYKFWRQ